MVVSLHMLGLNQLGRVAWLFVTLVVLGCSSAPAPGEADVEQVEQVQQALAAAPTITSFSPAKAVQGTLVTVRGTGFVNGASVSFNGTPSPSVTFVSATRLTAVVPTGCTSGPISVSAPLGTASSATPFLVLPKVASLSASQGFVGDSVTVSGSGFSDTTSVAFGSVAAAFTVSSDASVSVEVPTGFTSAKLTLSTPQGSSTTSTSFAVLPLVTGFSPTQGLVGQNVSLSGVGFSIASAVKLGTKAASFTIVSDTEISATVPVGAANGKFTVETPRGNRTSSATFTVIKTPTISSFTPATSALPVTLTINGTNLGSATAVKLGNVVLPTFTIVSSTRLTALVPDWTPSGRVAVTNPAGTATSTATFFAIQCSDQDADKVCDSNDQCPGFDDHIDSDTDGVADGCDICPSAASAGQTCGPGLACDGAGACSVELVCDASTQGPGVLQGNVVVDGVNTAGDLAALAGKWCVTGNLSVAGTALPSLSALHDLVEVGGNLSIGGWVPGCYYPCSTNNAALSSLDGLQQLRRVGGYLQLQEGYGSPGVSTLSPLAGLKSVGELYLQSVNAITDLNGLNGLRSVSRFAIEGAGALTTLAGIDNLRSAAYVRVADAPMLRDMTALSGITEAAEEFSIYRTGLSSLAGAEHLTSGGFVYFGDNPHVTDLSPLANLRSVSALGLATLPGVTSLAPLSGLTNAQEFWVFGLGITNLDGLQNLTSVRSLELSYNNYLVDLSALSQVPGINMLRLSGNNALPSLATLSQLNVQYELWLRDNPLLADCGSLVLGSGANITVWNNAQLASLSCLQGAAHLGELTVRDNAALVNLDDLASLTTLDGNLNLANNFALASLTGLSSLTSVRSVNVYGQPLLVDLAGLQGVSAVYDLGISQMASLSSLHGLENLTSVYGSATFDGNPELPQCAIAQLELQIGRPVNWNQGNTGTGSCGP